MPEVITTQLDTLAMTLMDLDSVGEGDGDSRVWNGEKRTILDLISDVGEGVRGGESGAGILVSEWEGANSGAK